MSSPEGQAIPLPPPTTPTTSPHAWQWFCTAEQLDLTTEEMEAYGLPDYHGPRVGPGWYVDLYADPAREQPIGRLWAADGNRAGLIHVDGEDTLEYVRVALRLRRLNAADVDSLDAFEEIAEEYTCDEVFQGDLEDIEDPEIPENAGI